MTKWIQHHTKYLEIHGVDEIVLLTESEHRALHSRLHREGKCNVPVKELRKIAKKAFDRSPKKTEYDRNVKRRLQFTETLSPNLELFEVIEYNRNTGNVSVSSYFVAHHKNRSGYRFIGQIPGGPVTNRAIVLRSSVSFKPSRPSARASSPVHAS